ncbi:hypothetical protein VDG1235_651 [Verrucomicrobiia bacterium DG1235]|nr:hypothetical protein VDG1235_651 [Verrucomicrobiae bacterium DG1235]
MSLTASWRELSNGKELRVFSLVITIVVVWSFSFYGYNLYYGRFHTLERSLLVVLALGVVWRPFFLVLFLWWVSTIHSQFNFPFGLGFKAPVESLLVECLMLVSSWHILSSLTGWRRIDGFLVLVCSLIAGHYFYPGLGKLKMDWAQTNQVGLFFVAAHAHGWLDTLSTDTVSKVVQVLLKFNPLLLLATLAAELGGLVILFKRKIFRVLIVVWVCFHIGVFLLSGFLFWQWIVLICTLWLVFFRNERSSDTSVFGGIHALTSIVLIAGISFWARPPSLAWFDTGLDYNFTFEAVLEDGETRTLPPNFFSPYRDVFSFSIFGDIYEEPQLLRSYGATGNKRLAVSISSAKSTEEIRELESALPEQKVSQESRERLARFLVSYLTDSNGQNWQKRILSMMKPPATFWTSSIDYPISDLAGVKSINVSRVTSYFNGERIVEIDRSTIMEIDVRSGEIYEFDSAASREE